ncbi:hypothetical protein GWI33_020163 [Rhynchophorus ferrugineus]|uniref:Uncharacterized protein n=1 Tax=Rhynchophorus ferrugineus TaxID=354439 RepID=A0A834HS39_RHYFE|nr:hypothetical protein GWI33_020163 [Rhynchophorus ferrugineus]
MNTEDGERSGRPKVLVTDENIKKIHKMIFNDRKLKLNQIADTLNISTERVHQIINEYLGRSSGKTAAFEGKESAASPRQCTVSQVSEKYGKNPLSFELLPHPFSRSGPSDCFLFSDPKRMLAGMKFSSNEEVIADTETYFEAKDKSYYKNTKSTKKVGGSL